MQENKSLKYSLVLQSFTPLFVLVLIQHFQISFFSLPCKVCTAIQQSNFLEKIYNFSHLGDFFASALAILWLIFAFLVNNGLKGMLQTNFRSAGEQVIIYEDKRDCGASFLVTFVIPMFIEDVNTLRGGIVFISLLLMIIILMNKSNLFYQNPVLALLGYECFEFKFQNAAKDIKDPDRLYLGITKGRKISTGSSVKRKYIADNVFLIFNE